MKNRVLVVDDEFERRRPGYLRLAEACSKMVSGFSIDMDFVTHPNELAVRLRTAIYSAAIVDAVLDVKWNNYSISQALEALGDQIPVAILSAHWDKTNSEQINSAWKHKNCRTFLHWRDIDPNGNGQVDYAVRALTTMIADNKGINTRLHLAPGDPVRVVHISDVQAGGFNDHNLKLEVSKCADLILEHWDDCPPTFVAFTGDVAEHGNPIQYKQACDWIGYFCERLGLGALPSSSILYVPGNHDVNVFLAAASRLAIQEDKHTGKVAVELRDSQEMDLVRYALAPFREFLSDICDCQFLQKDPNDQSLSWVEGRYRHLGIVFYGINTAQPASIFGLPDRRVDPVALAAIMDELSRLLGGSRDSLPLVVGLAHHCPTSASEDGAVANPGDFETFFRRRIRTALFMHGHTHEHDLSYQSSDGLRIVRSCATTLTKPEKNRPRDSVRGFNLLELRRENHVVKELLGASYGWIGRELKEIKRGGPWVRDGEGMFREK